MGRPGVADAATDAAVVEALGDRRAGVAGVEADGEGVEAEALDLAVEPGEIGPDVVDVGGRGVGVGDDGVAPVHRAMVEVEEALGLALADHVAGLRIGPADLDLLLRRSLVGERGARRPLAVRRPVGRNVLVEGGEVVRPRALHQGDVRFVLVGVGLQVRGIGVEHRPVHQPVAHRLKDDLVEDLLEHRRLVESPPPVLADRGGVRHLVRQPKTEEPAIGHVHLDLAHQLPLRAHPEQVADQQHLEEQHRIQRRPPVVRAVEVSHRSRMNSKSTVRAILRTR